VKAVPALHLGQNVAPRPRPHPNGAEFGLQGQNAKRGIYEFFDRAAADASAAASQIRINLAKQGR
jgi:hypothetical protein